MPTPLELKEPLVQKPEAERASGYSEAGHAPPRVALAPPSGWARLARFLAVFGVETAEEAKLVCLLALQAHLANAVFALGRNIGPVLFMQLVGARGLTLAVFLSGLARAAERTVARGERFSRAGESYFLICGRVRREARQEEHEAGDALQELGCIYAELPPLRLEAATESRLLVLHHSSLWELMVHLPPKFALSLLRALVQLAPKPSQPGAGRQPMAPGSARPGVAVSELEAATSTADAK
ncbi:hypothetical protein AB1Y20_013406, partial [Prymnesium parvum]